MAIEIFGETVIANADAAFAAINVIAVVEKDEAVVKFTKAGGLGVLRLYHVFAGLQPLSFDVRVDWCSIVFAATEQEDQKGE